MMFTIPTAYAAPPPNAEPAFAKTEINTCSFMLNGPGFNVHSLPPNPGTVNFFSGRTFAMNRPIGRLATWTEIMEMTKGCVRYAKKVLRKERRTHDTTPKNHMRKVKTGRVGSSTFDTVRRTSSIGEMSSSSSIS